MTPIKDKPEWVGAIRDAVAAAHIRHATQGCFDSHDIVNWLNEHRNDILNEIVDNYGHNKDPAHRATVQIGCFIRDWMGQDKSRHTERESERYMNLRDGTRHGRCKVSVWSISQNTQLGGPKDRTQPA